jgi:glycosyltransferase involved in cell wall biosynthesis
MSFTENNRPMVSVIMITYGHKAYIAEAIEGVLMQEVNFPVELIIADDCSPDHTGQIVQWFIDNHPKGSWIKYTRHSQNKGMMPNFIWALEQARGEFIALCEGDDYWVDKLKIEKQVKFLKSHSDYNIVFHKAKILLENGMIVSDQLLDSSIDTLEIKDVFKGNFMHTPTIMFRNIISKFPDWFQCAMPGDHPLQILLLLDNKKAKNLAEPMSVYRKHSEGIWSPDFGKRHLFERAITKIEINKLNPHLDRADQLNPLFMLADHIFTSGYKKIGWLKYQKILFSNLSILSFFQPNYLYLFHPRTYFYVKKLNR